MAGRRSAEEATEKGQPDGGEGVEKQADAAPDGETADAIEQVQTVAEKEAEQGFRGTEVDPTPNENYTVAGVTAGLPTPETDADTAADIAGVATTKFNNK